MLYSDAKFTKNFGGTNSKVTWASNWNSGRYLNEKQVAVSPGSYNMVLEFVPQLWSTDAATRFADNMPKVADKRSIAAENAAVTNLLAFNEPNQCGRGGTCTADPSQIGPLVESYIKLLQPHGKQARLGSPSVTNGPDGIPWLKEFMRQCSACQIDFVQAHWYGGSMTDFKAYVEKFHKDFPNKPIWITEFALDAQQPPENQLPFLKEAMAYMDGLDYVERYAYFMAAPMNNSVGLVHDNGSLTGSGLAYNSQ